MRTARALLLVIAALVAGSGCASFSLGKLPEAQPWPPSSSGTTVTTVSLNLNYQQVVNGRPTNLFRGTAENVTRQMFQEVLAESGLARVATSGGADLNIAVRYTNRGYNNMLMSIITGLSLYLIPSSATDEWELDADVTDKSGNTVGRYQLVDGVVTWQHAILIPVMPFKLLVVVAPRVQRNIVKTLILRMKDDGLFR